MYSFLDSTSAYERIDSIRKEKGMSIYELAKRSGVSCAAIYKWRDNKSTPSMYLLESLCYALGISLSYLFEDSSVIDGEGKKLTEKDKEFACLWSELDEDKRKKVIDYMQELSK